MAFVVLTFALCSPFYFLIISAGTVNVAGGLFLVAIMWCPGVAALLTRLFFQRNLHGIGWRWGKTRYQISGYVIPLVAGISVYGLVWTLGIGGVSAARLTSGGADLFGIVRSASLPFTLALAGTIGFVEMVTFVTGEELVSCHSGS